MPGKLHVDKQGHIRGDAKITYNDPFPTANGSYGSGAMQGVIMHTMVGDLPGTISVFNNPNDQASATFGISQTGEIHQFGPIGKGWYAWAQVAGNRAWYSIEHADHGDPNNKLTDAQITASAQIVECLSDYAGFPLQPTNSVDGKGFGVHFMGGASWGGHTCPDVPGHTVRSSQRPAILELAKAIRDGAPKAPAAPAPDKPLKPMHRLADGKTSLVAAAKEYGHSVARVVFLSATHRTADFSDAQEKYILAGKWSAPMPLNMSYWA